MTRAFQFPVLLSLLAVCMYATAQPHVPETPMNLESFSSATINVIQEEGLSEYLPTLVFVETAEIRVIEGIPDDIDHRTAIQNVVRRAGHNSKEFFFGVLSSPNEITIGHHRPGEPPTFMMITEAPGGFSVKELKECEWWNIE